LARLSLSGMTTGSLLSLRLFDAESESTEAELEQELELLARLPLPPARRMNRDHPSFGTNKPK
jgi:hypothetical protein